MSEGEFVNPNKYLHKLLSANLKYIQLMSNLCILAAGDENLCSIYTLM